MALYGVSIEKTMLWHNVQEVYDNTYFYEGPDEAPAAAGLQAFVDAIVNAERNVHGVNVAFRRARVWTAGGSPLQNITIGLFDLSGTGKAIGNQMFGETAVQVEWECARPNILGRKVYLRKFIRSKNIVGNMDVTASIGETPIDAGARGVYKAYGDAVQRVVAPAGVAWDLVSPSGRRPKAPNNAVVNPFVSSREFRRN